MKMDELLERNSDIVEVHHKPNWLLSAHSEAGPSATASIPLHNVSRMGR